MEKKREEEDGLFTPIHVSFVEMYHLYSGSSHLQWPKKNDLIFLMFHRHLMARRSAAASSAMRAEYPAVARRNGEATFDK